MEFNRFIVKMAMKKVKKGLVRSTVLSQIHSLENSINLLYQGMSIKKKEIKEFADEDKAEVLRTQVSIIEEGIGHIREAVRVLDKYKKYTTNS